MTTASSIHSIALAAPTAQAEPTARFPVNWKATLGINNTSARRPNYTFNLTYGNGTSFTYKFTADSALWSVWTNGQATRNLTRTNQPYTPSDGFTNGDDKRSIASPRGGTVTLNAGAGNDFIFVANQGTALNADMGDGVDFALGGMRADFIQGRAGNDVLFGAAGDDTLHGDAGNDVIDGGDGNDRIRGGVLTQRISAQVL